MQVEFGYAHQGPSGESVAQQSIIVLPPVDKAEEKRKALLAERQRRRAEREKEEARIQALLAEWDGTRAEIAQEEADRIAAERHAAAATIQARVRGIIVRRWHHHCARQATTIEAVVRGFLQRQRLAMWHARATVIERFGRGRLARHWYRNEFQAPGMVVKLPGTAPDRARCVQCALDVVARVFESHAPPLNNVDTSAVNGIPKPQVLVLPTGGRFVFGGTTFDDNGVESATHSNSTGAPSSARDAGAELECEMASDTGSAAEGHRRVGWEPGAAQWFRSRAQHSAPVDPASPVLIAEPRQFGTAPVPLVTAELQPVARLHAREAARLSVAAGYGLLAQHRCATGPTGTNVYLVEDRDRSAANRSPAVCCRWRWAMDGLVDADGKTKGQLGWSGWIAPSMAADKAPAGRVEVDDVFLSHMAAAGYRRIGASINLRECAGPYPRSYVAARYPLAEHHHHERLFGPTTPGGSAFGHQLPWLMALPADRAVAVVLHTLSRPLCCHFDPEKVLIRSDYAARDRLLHVVIEFVSYMQLGQVISIRTLAMNSSEAVRLAQAVASGLESSGAIVALTADGAASGPNMKLMTASGRLPSAEVTPAALRAHCMAEAGWAGAVALVAADMLGLKKVDKVAGAWFACGGKFGHSDDDAPQAPPVVERLASRLQHPGHWTGK